MLSKVILTEHPIVQSFRACLAPALIMMTTRLACIELLRARIGEWNHNLNVGFRTGCALYRLPLELTHGLESFFSDSGCDPSLLTS